MHTWLLFQLYGPMSSWGDIAVGEARGTETHPGRSALIGLLAAALGLRRDEETKLRKLAGSFRFAVEVRSPGYFLRDYHTAQVPVQSALKKHPSRTRRDELMVDKDKLGTILSARDYRCDAFYRIALEATDGSAWSLDEVASALREPVFPLYLGRKSCPLGLPLAPQLVEAPNLVMALAQVAPMGPDSLGRNKHPGKTTSIDTEPVFSLYWDDGMALGIEPEQTFTRRDQPRSRGRWQFDQRQENHARIPRGE